MKLAIVITGLSTGGAEMMLLKLLERMDRRRFDPHVFSLTTLGDIGPRIGALGIPVEALNMPRGRLDPRGLWRLIRRLRELQVDVVHTWMYHADLLGGLAARVAGVRTVIWGIRNSVLHQDSRSTRLVMHLNARLSHWLPKGILSCSEIARDLHVARGYRGGKFSVIPNGFDLERFKPDPTARVAVREELNLSAQCPLVGIVGRADPIKNHAGFIEAAGFLRRRVPDVHFVLVGSGVDNDNTQLTRAAVNAGVGDACHFLGRRDDIPRCMAALDVLASSSHGEAFPNVLGEAMACGVPCAVTNAGDCAAIVGDTGRVVGVGDMVGLAEAMGQLLTMRASDRVALGARARERVKTSFDIADVVHRYEDYYAQLT